MLGMVTGLLTPECCWRHMDYLVLISGLDGKEWSRSPSYYSF